MRRRILSIGLGLAAVLPVLCLADVGPPAHLRVTESEPGRFVTQWRVPKMLPPNAVPTPELPPTCEPRGELSVEEQARGWIFTQDWRCDDGLAGEIVGLSFPFVELALTTVVRVELHSGETFAHLVTPGDKPWRLPEGTAAPDRAREVSRAVRAGVGHVFRSWAHLPFMLVAGLLGGLRRSVRVVTVFSVGQLIGAAATAVAPGLGGVPAEIIVALTAAVLAGEALRAGIDGRKILAVASVGGLVHGLAVGSFSAAQAGAESAGVLVQLLGLLGMDAAHLVGAMTVAALSVRWVQGEAVVGPGKALAYVSGCVGVALALGLVFQGGAVETSAAGLTVTTPPQPSGGSPASASSRRIAPATPNMPIQSYLVVEPFEIRHEVMLRLGRLSAVTGLERDSILGIHEQPELADRLVAFVLDWTRIRVDGQEAAGVPRRADFMTVDAGGALPRKIPLPEPVDGAVVGVVIAYPTEGMAQKVALSWEPFPANVVTIPLAVVDPESTAADALSAGQPTFTWENSLMEDPIPTVSAVAVEPPRVPVPLLSIPLLAAALVLPLIGQRKGRLEGSIALTRVVLALALIVAPVLKTTVALPAFATGAPSEAQVRRILAGLLPNIYRAMEFRDEGLIFDRLAVSVTGETLTDVYLEQRKALELEERGGAQARVEAVEILDAREIESSDSGFDVQTTWTAAGMVTHFGHRHFRQNRYDARLTIVPVDDAWKIRSVEILEQERLK